jgi:hypothetical protein
VIAGKAVRHDQIAFGVADQMLHDPFDSRSLPWQKSEPEMHGEPHVVGGGDDHVGDHTRLQAAHRIGQHRPRHPPMVSKHSTSRPRVVDAFSSAAKHEPKPRPHRHRRHSALTVATRRRKLRGEPASPAARAFDSSGMAEIRPALAHPLREPIHVVVVVPTGGTLRDGVPGQVPQHDPLRRLCVVPHSSAALR